MSTFEGLDNKEKVNILLWFAGYDPETKYTLDLDPKAWHKIGSEKKWFPYFKELKEKNIDKKEALKMISDL